MLIKLTFELFSNPNVFLINLDFNSVKRIVDSRKNAKTFLHIFHIDIPQEKYSCQKL